jgi:hypothetical protein
MHTCQIDEALTLNWMNDYKKTQYEVKIVVNASNDGLPDWCLLLTWLRQVGCFLQVLRFLH